MLRDKRSAGTTALARRIATAVLLSETMKGYVALLMLMAAVAWSVRAWAGDPHLAWHTIYTPHYRIHYHGGLERQGQRIASLAELIRQRLGRELALTPRETVDILLTDSTDDANGSAQVELHDVITLFATAPDDMSPLGDYDDWLVELLTHEHTHISHLDNVSGVPALANAILGKRYTPNSLAPNWIAEGLAVALESKYSSGGRLRSSQFDMYLRADVLENNLATLDQIGNPARRWPSGTLWYLYGGNFVAWIEDVYGPDIYAAVAADYGAMVLPWGVNRAIRRATGRTYEQLYAGWMAHLREKYRDQLAAVRARGVREGSRLTWHGRFAGAPRFVPHCARRGATEELIYFRDDGHSTAGLYRLPLLARERAGEPELLARSSMTAPSFDATCAVVFDSPALSGRLYLFNELMRQPRGTRSPRGIEKTRQRLTTGIRARSPDVSPGGHRIVYVTNRAGTSTLRIADYGLDGALHHERALMPSARYEQAYTPRFSPDGRHVVYSVWTQGGYRDVRMVEVATGQAFNLTHDRAFDQHPTWAADGKTLFFVSDRTGIPNVYAYELESQQLYQVTNVINGAYFPEVTPDGKTLYYVGYAANGFDLFVLPLDRRQWLEAPTYQETRPTPLPEPEPHQWPATQYSPWGTVRPYAYWLQYGPGTLGPTVTVSTSGGDIVGMHTWSATVALDTRHGEPAFSVGYAYSRLPAALGLSVFRNAAPRAGYQYGDKSTTLIEYSNGVSSSITMAIPGDFGDWEPQSVTLSYSVAETSSELPVGDQANPYALVTREPYRGLLATLHLGYSYSNAESSHWGISAEKGFSLSLGSDLAAREIGSQTTLQSLTGELIGYLPMPWLKHHVLALAASGGVSAGSYPRRGYFYTGSFGNSSVVSGFQYGAIQSGLVLRGYLPAQFIGKEYNLYNAEYRFPLSYPDRGVSTLPIFLRTISAALYVDFGGAFDALNLKRVWDSYHLGLGAEMWIDLALGYDVGLTVRVGHGQGTDSKAPHGGQTYLVLAASF